MNIQPKSDEHLYIKQPGSTSVNVVDISTTGILITGGLTKNGDASNDKVWNTSGGTRTITTSVTSGSTDLVTAGAVWTAIDNLPDPMVFKGTLGSGSTATISALPVDGSAKVGDTYKVITDGTYAGQAAKVGDVFSCNGKTASANTWVYIPAGDDVEDTWRNLKINGTEFLGSGISTGALDIVNGNYTTPVWNSTNKTFQVNHNTTTRNDTSSTASPASGGNFTVVDSVTTNTYGHVTAVNVKTVTLPVDPNSASLQVSDTTNKKINTTETPGNTIQFVDGTNKFTVKDKNGTSFDVNVTPSIANNVTGTGTSGYLTKWSGEHTITNGPQLGSGTTTFLRNDGTWDTPVDTKVTQTVTTSGNTDYRPVILGYSALTNPVSGSFSTVTNSVFAAHKLYMSPASGNIINKGGNIKLESASSTDGCSMVYNATTKSLDFVF